MDIYSTNITLDGTTQDVYMRGIMPQSFYSNCFYGYKVFSLFFKAPSLIPPVSIQPISYFKGDPTYITELPFFNKTYPNDIWPTIGY